MGDLALRAQMRPAPAEAGRRLGLGRAGGPLRTSYAGGSRGGDPGVPRARRETEGGGMIIIAHIPDRRVGRRKIKRVIVNFERPCSASMTQSVLPTVFVCN